MKEKDFRFIENLATKEEGVSTINLFNSIDADSAARFIEEFKFIERYEATTRIDIRINSAGGSVLHGWSIVDTILNSNTPTRSICVGVAASMASVIMAAADEACMMSYASIMIHNPFYSVGEDEDSTEDEQLATFKSQLVDLYMKRWGMAKSEVVKLMDGNEGQDGTWFKATEALNKGIVSKIIKATPQQAKKFNKVQNEIINSSEAADLIQSKFQEVINNLKETKEHSMKEVKAKLGLEEAAAEAVVLTKVSALIEEANTLKETLNTLKGENATLKIGAEEVKNELSRVKDTLAAKEGEIEGLNTKVQEFEEKETQVEQSRRAGLIDAAVSEGKINEDDKELWASLFEANPEHAEKALTKLQAVGQKKKLSTQIKDDLKGEAEKEVKLPTINGVMDEIESSRR